MIDSGYGLDDFRRVLSIEKIDESRFDSVLPLIGAYQEFYGFAPDTSRNRVHFGRYLKQHDQGILFGAYNERTLVGFCTLYFLPSSLSGGTMCVMNDLYTQSAHRKMGVGQALVTHAKAYAKTRGFSSLDWWTAESNHTAHRLYDKIGGERTSWYLYTLPT